MNKLDLFLPAIALIYLMSCTQRTPPDKDVTVKRWYYEDGTLKKVQEYKDSIEQGKYLYYYPSGVLQDSAYVINGRFHGKRYEYHENGNLYILTNYINNKYRNAIDYRKDGTLEYYRAYNYAKELMYIIHYDSSGKPIKYDGDIIYSWVQEESYPVGKVFSIELLVADPPHCKTEVTVSDWDIKTNRAISEAKYNPDQFNRVNYTRKQIPEKDLYILNVAYIRDSITQATITDTLVIMVYKDGKSSYTRELSKQGTFYPNL